MKRWQISWLWALCVGCSWMVQAEDIGPKWQIGDRWTVETQSVQSPAGFKKEESRPVEWNFQVAGVEQVTEQDCFRVEVTCAQTGRPQPNVTLWVSRETGMMVRLTSRIPVGETYREYTESYVMTESGPTPVLGIIPSLPLDLPVFNNVSRNSKSLQPVVYESFTGSGHSKDLNDLRFAYAVTQTVTDVPQDRRKSLDSDVSKSVQVRISGGNQNVEQVWTQGQPWAVYSNNGTAISRLKGFVPAEKKEE